MTHKQRFAIGYVVFATIINTISMALALTEKPVAGVIILSLLIYGSGLLFDGLTHFKPEITSKIAETIQSKVN